MICTCCRNGKPKYCLNKYRIVDVEYIDAFTPLKPVEDNAEPLRINYHYKDLDETYSVLYVKEREPLPQGQGLLPNSWCDNQRK